MHVCVMVYMYVCVYVYMYLCKCMYVCVCVMVCIRDGTIHNLNFRFDFRYLSHGSIYSRYFSQPRYLSHIYFNKLF